MAISVTTTCDICGKAKAQVNCWWMASKTYITGGFLLLPWNDNVNHLNIHLCGRECAQKLMEQWMAEQGRQG